VNLTDYSVCNQNHLKSRSTFEHSLEHPKSWAGMRLNSDVWLSSAHFHDLFLCYHCFLHQSNHHTLHRVNMPRKARAIPLRQTYSRDLKHRVIYQSKVLGYPSTKISISLDMPLRCVQRVCRMWDEVGEVCKDRTRIGRAPLMSSDAVEVSLHPVSYHKLSKATHCSLVHACSSRALARPLSR
jgi:hypothetical protein